jgi:hypothetical protein
VKQSLTGDVGLDQRLAPTITGANAMKIDENIVFVPTDGFEPTLKRQGVNAVLGGMANEQTRHCGHPKEFLKPHSMATGAA